LKFKGFFAKKSEKGMIQAIHLTDPTIENLW